MRGTQTASALLALALCAGLCAPASHARQAVPAPAPEPTTTAEERAKNPLLVERERTRIAAGERIARTAILVLRAKTEPTVRDYRIAALTLGVAMKLAPDNQEYLRLQVAAWQGAGDNDRVLEASQRLIKMDPKDTVALLRVISMRIGAIQEAERRLAAYDRILGPDGAKFDESVRSRLALDSALLARERGDEAGFRDRLTLSTQLDPSNKQAAVLAWAYFAERSDDAMGRVEMLANVLLADPTDPSASLNLARELRREGAFAGASRFQTNAEKIFQRTGVLPTNEEFVESLVSRWLAGSSEEILASIEQVDAIAREGRRRQIEQAKAAGQPAGDPIEDYHLPLELETLRLAANLAIGRTSAAESSLRSIVAAAIKTLDDLANPKPGQTAPTQEEFDQLRERLASDVLWSRLWAGFETEQAEASLNALVETGDAREDALNRYRGWLALRKGDLTSAKALLAPLATTDPQARIGLATLAEATGDKQAASDHYAFVASSQPQTLLGAFARRRIETLLGKKVEPTETAKRLEAYAAKLPPWLNEMAEDTRSYIFLAASPVMTTATVVDGTHVRLSLRNVSRTPLSVGLGCAIPPRVLLTPSVNVPGRGGSTGESMQPEVIELDRRLRLKPGESIDAMVWAGQGSTGDFIDAMAMALTLRWRATVGFTTDGQGRLGAGPTSVTADAGLMSRPIVGSLGDSPEAIRKAIFDAQADTLLESMFFGRAIGVRTLVDTKDAAAKAIGEGLLQVFAQRMAKMSEVERAMTVVVVSGVQPRETITEIDKVAMQDPSRFVRLVYLAERNPAPDNPAYEAAIADPDPDWSELARLLREEAADRIAPAEAANPVPAPAPSGAAIK